MNSRFPALITSLLVATVLPISLPAQSDTAKARASPAASPAKFNWNVVKVGILEYVPLSDIAAFYQLPSNYTLVEKRANLDNGQSQLEVGIDSREAFINGVKHWFAFPVVQVDNALLISRLDLAKSIEPALRPNFIRGLKTFNTIVIDAGHGGHDKGAASAWGLEKNYSLDVARRLRDLLQKKGFKVVMTRDSDIFIPLEERARIANQYKNAIFVSVHFNATDFNKDANGFEIFSLTPRGAPSTADDELEVRHLAASAGHKTDSLSFPLAVAVQHAMLGHTPQFDRGVKRARFAVLRHTKIPSILVEGGFLSNTIEARYIASPAWRNKLAEAIADGIGNYKTLADTRKAPKLLAAYRASLPTTVTLRDATEATEPDKLPDGGATEVQPTSNTQAQSTSSTTEVK